MKNFEFFIPTRILFGTRAEEQVGRWAASYGKHALILYGSDRIRQSGLLEKTMKLLEAEGILCDTFSGITENPCLSQVREACRLVKKTGADMLLAIGGGSVIDFAKAVSIGSSEPEKLWDYYEQKEVPREALPLGVILTMAATASEANCVSVIRNEKTGQKLALRCPMTYPKFALMNPELTATVPKIQTAVGAVDIFAHAFERYFHKEQRGTLRDHLCAAIMKTVIEELPGVQQEPENYDGRSQLMWAATMAHSDMIGFEGVYACHAMSHILTGEFGLSHGAGLAILMPAWCKYMLAYEPKEMARFAVQVWAVEPDGRADEAVAQEGISRFQNFICQSGLSVTLREAGIVHCDSRKMAEKLIKDGESVGENFRRLGLSDVQAIFELAKG